MAKLIRCKQGHVFDAEAHDACPVCGERVVRNAVDEGLADDRTAPPPKPPRPFVLSAAIIAVIAIAATGGGYFALRPRADISPAPKPPVVSPAPAPSPTPGRTTASETPTPVPTPALSPPAAPLPDVTTENEEQARRRLAANPPSTPFAVLPAPGPTQANKQPPTPEPKATPASPQPTPTASSLKLAEVDVTVVGEWELRVNASRWILRIESNGAYAFHTEPLNAVKPDSGVFSAAAGHWSTRANNGVNDGGAYSLASADALVVTGRLGTATWRRVAGAPDSILGEVDPRTVGDWAIAVPSGRWVWQVKRDGVFEFRSEAKDGLKPSKGTFAAKAGRWSISTAEGYSDGGVYTFPRSDTFLATGHLGTGAWRRQP